MTSRLTLPLVALALATAALPAMSAESGDTLVVGPGGFASIQAAVDAASPGDTVLVMAGTYQEAVLVTTPNLVIRGVDRESVVLEGARVLDVGISVVADGVSVESLTVQNYNDNGVAFSNVNGFRMFDLHAKNNRVYGLYAIHSHDGEIAYSYAEGSGDGGIYIGETVDCDCDVHHNEAWNNAMGYSGTANSYVRIWANNFHDNRAGIVMSVLPNEMGVEDDGTFYGTQVRTQIYDNWVHHNNNRDAPEAGFAETVTIPVGMGIAIGGGWFNEVHGNVIEDNDWFGVGIFWLMTPPRGNWVHDNVIRGGHYGIWWDGWGEDHCFGANVFDGPLHESNRLYLPTCPGLAGDLPCPDGTERWLACRANDASVVDPLAEAELAWRVATDAGGYDHLFPHP